MEYSSYIKTYEYINNYGIKKKKCPSYVPFKNNLDNLDNKDLKTNLLINFSQQKKFTYGEYIRWSNLPFGNTPFSFKDYNNDKKKLI